MRDRGHGERTQQEVRPLYKLQQAPSYGVEGSRKAEFCTRHVTEEIEISVSTRCGHPTSCSRQPIVRRGMQQGGVFAQHVAEGIVNAVSKKSCSHPGFGTYSHRMYGVEDCKTAELCVQHVKKGMVGLTSKS